MGNIEGLEEEVEFVLAEAIVMPYSEEFSQGVNVFSAGIRSN